VTGALRIHDRRVGPGHSCFIIAEAGVNHDGDLDQALRLVEVAKAAGADAVKFQTYRTDSLVTAEASKAAYQVARTGGQESQATMLRRLELTPDAFGTIAAFCREKDILFLSTPFDEESARMLVDLEMPVIKVPSGELTNLPFIRALVGMGLPLIISTGMATLDEVRASVDVLRRAGGWEAALLHCVSDYPAKPEDANLRAMHTLSREFGFPVGWSDHCEGLEIALAARALGACIIEKHFTLDRTLAGPDHQASLEPDELKGLVSGVRAVERALGTPVKRPGSGELANRAVVRKSLVAARAIGRGEPFTAENLTTKRPADGCSPMAYCDLLGRSASRSYEPDATIDEPAAEGAP
jgi:N,N'-diacetyllegionaminate synthase